MIQQSIFGEGANKKRKKRVCSHVVCASVLLNSMRESCWILMVPCGATLFARRVRNSIHHDSAPIYCWREILFVWGGWCMSCESVWERVYGRECVETLNSKESMRAIQTAHVDCLSLTLSPTHNRC